MPREKVYICSPLNAPDQDGIIKNMLAARAYCTAAEDAFEVSAWAPHAWLPMFVDDNVPKERALALEFGMKMLRISNILFVCGNRISNGMREEIWAAAELNMPIIVFNRDLLADVKGLIACWQAPGEIPGHSEMKWKHEKTDKPRGLELMAMSATELVNAGILSDGPDTIIIQIDNIKTKQ